MASREECRKILLALSPLVPETEEREVVNALNRLGYDAIIVRVEGYEPQRLSALSHICKPPECCVFVPGSVSYDYSGLPEIVVLKGTYTLRALPLIMEIVEPRSLSPSLPAEKVLGNSMALVLERLYCSLISKEPLIPQRPPPIKVASEVYVDSFSSAEDAVEEAEARFEMGADIVVLASRNATPQSTEALTDAVKAAVRRGIGPLGVDPADRSLLPRLANTVDLLMSVWSNEALNAPWARGNYLVVLEPRGPEAIVKICDKLKDQGFTPVIDPVVLPPPRSLKAFIDLEVAKRMGLKCPSLLGINNVYEMLDADTTGSIALLTLMAAEAGASIVLVSEESGKSVGATAEAKTASVIASYTLYTGSPPKDVGLNLLTVKCKRYKSPHGKKKLEAFHEDKCLETVRRFARPWRC